MSNTVNAIPSGAFKGHETHNNRFYGNWVSKSILFTSTDVRNRFGGNAYYFEQLLTKKSTSQLARENWWTFSATTDEYTFYFEQADGTYKTETMPRIERKAGASVKKTEKTEKIMTGDAKPSLQDALEAAVLLKPDWVKVDELKWKFLVRTALKGKNIMMTGPSGTGKTVIAQEVAKVFGDSRKVFIIGMGSTQDARATLIGNAQYDTTRGTYFSESRFIEAIQTPHAIVLLDEISRATPDAWNILFPVLDPGQRTLQLDEKAGSPVIKVAEGVSFIATANIGSEYTATRVLDRALLDRFMIIEVPTLTEEDEVSLLMAKHPDADRSVVKDLVAIANATRAHKKKGEIMEMISTRYTVEAAELSADGFNLKEIAELVFYPLFDDSDSTSDRTFVKQLVQKYVKI